MSFSISRAQIDPYDYVVSRFRWNGRLKIHRPLNRFDYLKVPHSEGARFYYNRFSDVFGLENSVSWPDLPVTIRVWWMLDLYKRRHGMDTAEPSIRLSKVPIA